MESPTQVATPSDVEKRLGRALELDEVEVVEGLLEEAEILIESYMGTIPSPVPRNVTVVASRMVARVLTAPSDGFSVDSASYTAGAFSMSKRFTAGASGGAPWLTAADKRMLKRRSSGGIYTIGLR